MRTFVALGMASLALSFATTSANAGHAGGVGFKGSVAVSCDALVQNKYCGGHCKGGSPEQAQARAALGVCMQNGGKL